MNKDIRIYFYLGAYLRRMVGPHYPKEIVNYIMINVYTPLKVKVKCGLEHSVALIGGKVYVWGRNDLGQIGLIDSDKIIIPQELSLTGIKKIKCYMDTTCIITHQNETYFTGKPEWYQGYAITYKCNKTVLNKFRISNVDKFRQYDMVKKGNDMPCVRCWNLPESKIEKLKYGAGFYIIQMKSGELYSRGNNIYGQLGIGYYSHDEIISLKQITLENVIKFNCGESHTVALTSDHEVFIWGRNNDGQLGLGDKTNRNVPTRLRLYGKTIISVKSCANNTMALTSNGDVYFWGGNYYSHRIGSSNAPICSPQKLFLSRIRSISCGMNYSVAVHVSGLIWVWGSNGWGQLGLGDQSDRKKPTTLHIKTTST